MIGGFNTLAWNRIRYTLYAPFYDFIVRRLARPRAQAIRLIDIQPGERVLLSGCGTGIDLDLLPAGIEVVATDISPAMVSATRKRMQAHAVKGQALCMDSQQLDLPDKHFDAVLLHLIVAVAPDGQSVVNEAARVLKDGGRISIFDKFLARDSSPGFLRKCLDVVTSSLFSSIVRRIEPMLQEAELEVVRDEPVYMNGFFRAIVAKPKG